MSKLSRLRPLRRWLNPRFLASWIYRDLNEPVNPPPPPAPSGPQLPRLYRSRAHLRAQWRKFWDAADAGDLATANRIRAALPRPIGDHEYWDQLLKEAS